MSLETWRAEFYPVPADQVPKEEAVAHSLKKWEGLRKENLEKHGLWKNDPGISIEDAAGRNLYIDGDTCSLCQHYSDRKQDCGGCPLSQARGVVPCDKYMEGESIHPYEAFIGNDPEPMINWLKKAKDYEDTHGR